MCDGPPENPAIRHRYLSHTAQKCVRHLLRARAPGDDEIPQLTPHPKRRVFFSIGSIPGCSVSPGPERASARASISTALKPACLAQIAAAQPAGPPPIINTSVCIARAHDIIVVRSPKHYLSLAALAQRRSVSRLVSTTLESGLAKKKRRSRKGKRYKCASTLSRASKGGFWHNSTR